MNPGLATLRFLDDGKRFVRESERNGWRNYYLYDLSGNLLATLTNHEFEVAGIVRIDEAANKFYYLAQRRQPNEGAAASIGARRERRCAVDGSEVYAQR